MKREVILSICIPTYNREKYLPELINSIINQTNEKNRDIIQICISDNCSEDNTKIIIENYIEEGKIDVILNINEKNIGPDLNYLKAVEIATGDYCWLMGSDDVIKENSINLILDQINQNNSISVFLGNRDECNKNLEFIQKRFWLDSEIDELIIDFSNEEEIIDYFKKCNSLGGIFSYLSSIIVRRNDWQKIMFDQHFNGTAYSHVYMLLSILNNSKQVKYFSNSIVKCRFENDSFYDNVKQRLLLDFYGYYSLLTIFMSKKVQVEGMKILTREHIPKRLYAICQINKFSKEEIALIEKFGYNKMVINNLVLFSKYHRTYKKIRYILKQIYSVLKSTKNK